MNVMILGPAGCGKSSLTGHFGSYLQRQGDTVRFLNLDPGCIELPYRCDFDIRDLFTVERIMREERLGPGGAMTRAMELLTRTKIPKKEATGVLAAIKKEPEAFALLRKIRFEQLSKEEKEQIRKQVAMLKAGKLTRAEVEELLSKLRITAAYYKQHKYELEKEIAEWLRRK